MSFNPDRILSRYTEFWNKENHDRPLLSVFAPKPGYAWPPIPEPATMKARWEDVESVVRRSRAAAESLYYAGEACPQAWANLGPDVFGAFLGCEIEYAKDTSWAVHFVQDWKDHHWSEPDWNNHYLKKVLELTDALLDDSRGDYLVGITDLHAGMDALVSLRGPQELCFDLMDDPEPVLRALDETYRVFDPIYRRLHRQVAARQKGSTNWMGVVHPEGWYVTGCDFMCMISHEMYKEFVEPGVRHEIALFGNAIFHLDGPGALKHLDSLLLLPELQAIQWVYGAGQPPAREWIPVLKRIQAAGKGIQLSIVPEDLPPLLEALRPEGVHFSCWCASPDEADALVRMAERAYMR